MMTASYDDLWQTAWGDIQRFGPVHRHMHEDVLRVVTSLNVHTILDVGCGSGDALALLASERRYEVTGTDLSAEAVRRARERLPVSTRLEQLDIERDRLDGRFDLVMSVQVVEHLVDDVAALRNMASMAEKYVFTSTIGGRMRRSEIPIGHVRNYSRIELSRKLELAGLRVLWVRGWGFPFYSPLYRSLAELLPAGPPTGEVDDMRRVVARLLYELYKLNLPGRGDVLSALAVPAR
jgi:SAM-dependent methyltransferase